MGFYVSESESHLTYMIDITLTVEFVLNNGVRWWERTRSSDWSTANVVIGIAASARGAGRDQVMDAHPLQRAGCVGVRQCAQGQLHSFGAFNRRCSMPGRRPSGYR